MRNYSLIDKMCMSLDKALRNFHKAEQLSSARTVLRRNPASLVEEGELTTEEQRHAAGLMRVNHVGEVCAQALYQGQALTADLQNTRVAMQQAAAEEKDHLDWCAERLNELNSHASYLNPIWYVGAYSLGLIAGACGDKWSLGFVAETENQVVQHLESHQKQLPSNDHKSRAIVMQMKIDEAEHARQAKIAGAAELPQPIKTLMRFSAAVMTKTAYFI